MDQYTATELAYKHGYEKGYAAGKPKWIPVSERLPESMEWVLCACRANILEVLRYDPIMGDWDTTMPNRCYMKGFVTHWMPLPEPPKEDA